MPTTAGAPCSPVDPAFTNVGPHWSPSGATHGHHEGDLPSLLVQADGTGIGAIGDAAVRPRELVGRAVILHAGPDNLANVPDRYSTGTPAVPGPDAATKGTGTPAGASPAASSSRLSLLTAPSSRRRSAAVAAPVVIAGFAIGGAVWGVGGPGVDAARSPADPEFSWSGTLFIVGAVHGRRHRAGRRPRRHAERRWPRWAQAIVRVPVAFVSLFLGFGAGTVMLPALVAGSLALGRTDWRRGARSVLAGVAALNAAAMIGFLGGDLGVVRTAVGWLLMLLLYGVIIGALSLNLRPLGDGWHWAA